MFLISKIVRGRRLLHELEQQEKDEAAAAHEAAHSIAQVSRRPTHRHRRNPLQGVEMEDQPGTSKGRRRKSVRKTEPSSSVDSSLDEDRSLRRTSSMPSLCEAMMQAEVATGSTMKPYNYEAKLNKLQRRALRFTWHRLQTRNGGKRVEQVFEEVYDRLVRQLPQIRDMFTTRMFLCAMSRNETASLRDHAKVTVKMVDLAIKNLDVERSKRTDTGTSQDPRMIGRVHGPLRPYGLTGQYWEKFGETMIDVVLCQEAVRDLPGAGQAWVIVIACLVDQLRHGFEENRSLHVMFPKQSTVLQNATKQLHDTQSPSVEECSLPRTSSEETPPPSEERVTVEYVDSGFTKIPFTPRMRRQQTVAEENPSSSASSSVKSCPFESRGSMRQTRSRSTSEQPPVITIK